MKPTPAQRALLRELLPADRRARVCWALGPGGRSMVRVWRLYEGTRDLAPLDGATGRACERAGWIRGNGSLSVRGRRALESTP